MIYFIRVGKKGPIKIGTSANPEDRLRALQRGFPYRLTLIGWVRGGRKQEQQLHKRFASLRTRGEWFRPAECLLDYIKEHGEAGNLEDERPPSLRMTPFLFSMPDEQFARVKNYCKESGVPMSHVVRQVVARLLDVYKNPDLDRVAYERIFRENV